MRKRSVSASVLASVLAVAAAPLAAAAADAVVGGHGPRIRAHDGRLLAFERPVFVVVDELAAFGRLPPAEAPPLVIEVQGDVELTPQPDGGLRIRFLDEDE